jgi:N-acyl homoserine lactone hydrolase
MTRLFSHRTGVTRIDPFIAATLLVAAMLAGCTATSHPERPASLGHVVDQTALERTLNQPGIVELQTVESADWEVELSGLLNLDSPQAKAAGLRDRNEPIKVYLYALRHPSRGLYLIDTGISAQMARDPGSLGANRIVQYAMHFERLKFHVGPAEVIKQNGGQLQGVFLTHAHLDHLGGLSEVPLATPIYVGPGETTDRHWTHAVTASLTDQLLSGRPNLLSWNFAPSLALLPEKTAPLAIIDIFGDASVFAISVPGHTSGGTAYLVRTPTGPVLLTGDTCHTRWGWDNGVEPGNFTRDGARNLDSLLKLKALVARHPQIKVRLGHQP